MKKDIIVLNEWLTVSKASFKILIVVSVLSDNKLAFRGRLNDLCEEIGIQKTAANRNRIRNTLDVLSDEGYIKMIIDGNTYTISLAESAEKSANVKKIKKVWYTILRETKAECGWDSLLKTFIYLIDGKQDKAITYKEIGENIGLSAQTIGRCVRILKNLEFPSEYGKMIIHCDAETCSINNTVLCTGTWYTVGIHFENM